MNYEFPEQNAIETITRTHKTLYGEKGPSKEEKVYKEIEARTLPEKSTDYTNPHKDRIITNYHSSQNGVTDSIPNFDLFQKNLFSKGNVDKIGAYLFGAATNMVLWAAIINSDHNVQLPPKLPFHLMQILKKRADSTHLGLEPAYRKTIKSTLLYPKQEDTSLEKVIPKQEDKISGKRTETRIDLPNLADSILDTQALVKKLVEEARLKKEKKSLLSGLLLKFGLFTGFQGDIIKNNIHTQSSSGNTQDSQTQATHFDSVMDSGPTNTSSNFFSRFTVKNCKPVFLFGFSIEIPIFK